MFFFQQQYEQSKNYGILLDAGPVLLAPIDDGVQIYNLEAGEKVEITRADKEWFTNH